MSEKNEGRPDVEPGGIGEEVYKELEGPQGDSNFINEIKRREAAEGAIIRKELVDEMRYYKLKLSGAAEGIVMIHAAGKFTDKSTLKEIAGYFSNFMAKVERGDFRGKRIPYEYYQVSAAAITNQLLEENYAPNIPFEQVLKAIKDKYDEITQTLDGPTKEQ